MFRHQQELFYRAKPDKHQTPKAPREECVEAVRRLSLRFAVVEVDYNFYGYARTLTTTQDTGFVGFIFTPVISENKIVSHAKQLLTAGRNAKSTSDVYHAIGMKGITLTSGKVFRVPLLGWRVEFGQTLKVKGRARSIPVLNGFVNVYMDISGRVFSVVSTLRRGRKPSKPSKLIKPKEAIKTAMIKHGTQAYEHASCELTYSSHEGRFNPIYKVVLSSNQPEKKVWQYLVEADKNRVVYGQNKLMFFASRKRPGNKKPRGKKQPKRAGYTSCKCLLRIPDPKIEIVKQMMAHHIDNLPDPKYLRNDRFDVMVEKGGKWKTVVAKPDGTYNYKPDSAEFEALCVFVAINEQDELFESLGAPKADRPMPVFVRDKSVENNAYVDPVGWEMHTGVGSGPPDGLAVVICYDLGVPNHENGHRWVAIIAPSHDFPGSEGEAGNEGILGDMCDLVMEYWRLLKYGKLFDFTLTKEHVMADPRIIGVYALPPDGIRKQRNQKKYPQDVDGEPHNDGLVVGGAAGDLLEAIMVDPILSLEGGLIRYTKLLLAMTALVPEHKVLFKDFLRAFITADQKLFHGAYRQKIEKCFLTHGITLEMKVTDPDALTDGDSPKFN